MSLCKVSQLSPDNPVDFAVQQSALLFANVNGNFELLEHVHVTNNWVLSPS